MANFIHLGSVRSFLSHTRFRYTLRSVARPSDYHSLLLFRLPAASLQQEDGYDVESSATLTPRGALDLGVAVGGGSKVPEDQWYSMVSTCPHLGAEMSHADIEECGPESVVAVCPWHRYDFDLKTGKSETGMQACTYAVEIRPSGEQEVKSSSTTSKEVWVESPGMGAWDVVEVRPVSEEFADPPPVTLAPAPVSEGELAERMNGLTVEDTVPEPTTLLDWAVLILNTANPDLKIDRSRRAIAAFRTGKLRSIGRSLKERPVPPDVPPREQDLNVVAPGKVAKRGKAGSLKSRIAILHALANIEQWAVDLSWDMIARFGNDKVAGKYLPQQFFSDWVKVAEDEAKHFTLLRKRLTELGSFYGEQSVHAGLWESAQDTAYSLSARLCIIHLVHEARGLDVNPATIAKFRAARDDESVRILEIIHHDEITHVTAGHRWFSWVCEQTDEDPIATFREQVRRHFMGAIKGPFNEEDRRRAGMTPEFYENLRGEGDTLKAGLPPPLVPETGGAVAVGYQ